MAFEALQVNRVRSMLTALGIIFGVAAVIAMLAIGKGAKQEILDQIKLVGVNNIVIQSVKSELPQESDQGEQTEKKKYSAGLSLQDAQCIRDIVPTVLHVSPEVVYESFALQAGKRSPVKLVGVDPEYFDMYNLKLSDGRFFNDEHIQNGSSVCIIGPEVRTKLFSGENPVGKFIKCDKLWLEVLGVLEPIAGNESSVVNNKSSGGDFIYAPLQTVFLRYKNRGLITEASLKEAENRRDDDEENSANAASISYNELDKIVVQVKETEMLQSTSEIIGRMLNRRHREQADFEIVIPELLLKQQQKTKDIFNMVLGIIAGISLIIGGIGIMNIMLASVFERIKEIGLRLALGATKIEIELQFITEAAMISIGGGIVGILLGVLISILIQEITGIMTIVSFFSIVLSFVVSATVGIVFGYMPAKRAAEQDPVTSLRYE